MDSFWAGERNGPVVAPSCPGPRPVLYPVVGLWPVSRWLPVPRHFAVPTQVNTPLQLCWSGINELSCPFRQGIHTFSSSIGQFHHHNLVQPALAPQRCLPRDVAFLNTFLPVDIAPSGHPLGNHTHPLHCRRLIMLPGHHYGVLPQARLFPAE